MRYEVRGTRYEVISFTSYLVPRTSYLGEPFSALAAALLQQAHGVDGGAAVHGFDHVVEGQGGDTDRRQGFHLDAGWAAGGDAGGDHGFAAVSIARRGILQFDLHRD